MTVMATAWHRMVSVSWRLKHTHIFVALSGRAVAADRHASQPLISATGGQLPEVYSKSHAKTRSGFPAGKLPTACVRATGGMAYGHRVAEADTVSAHRSEVLARVDSRKAPEMSCPKGWMISRSDGRCP
jgi:hypothetical protein